MLKTTRHLRARLTSRRGLKRSAPSAVLFCTAFALTLGCTPRDAAAHDAGAAVKPVAQALNLLQIKARETPGTGRAVIFDLHVPADHPPILSLAATFGAHQAATARWKENGRHWLLVTSVEIDEPKRQLELVLTGTYANKTPLYAVRQIEVEEAKYDRRNIRVSKKFVEPPKKAQKRAAKEREDLKVALAGGAAERLWRGSFQRPVSAKATSPFGTLRTYNTRRKASRHLGWDLDGKVGDPIVAAGRARVALVQDRYYSGGTVLLDHGQGLFTMYFHLSEFTVKTGQWVEKGQLIGKVGKSGRVTGPHLHFSVKLDGVYLSPKTLLVADFLSDPKDPNRKGGRAAALRSSAEPTATLSP